MKRDQLWNYYEVDSYCCSEGLETDYFIHSIRGLKIKKRGKKKLKENYRIRELIKNLNL